MRNGIHETTEYLELFLRNLLLEENNELKNRTMHISGRFNNSKKVDIDETKVDIDHIKMDIEEKFKKQSISISNKTISHTLLLYSNYKDSFFGRNLVEQSTGLKSSQASKLIKLLLDVNIIEPVKGHGKGKYRFVD